MSRNDAKNVSSVSAGISPCGAQCDDLEQSIVDDEQAGGKLHRAPAGVAPGRFDRFGSQNPARIAWRVPAMLPPSFW